MDASKPRAFATFDQAWEFALANGGGDSWAFSRDGIVWSIVEASRVAHVYGIVDAERRGYVLTRGNYVTGMLMVDGTTN